MTDLLHLVCLQLLTTVGSWLRWSLLALPYPGRQQCRTVLVAPASLIAVLKDMHASLPACHITSRVYAL